MSPVDTVKHLTAMHCSTNVNNHDISCLKVLSNVCILGIGNTIGPMFLCEIAPAKNRQLRGSLSAFHQLFITIGFLIATILGHPGVYGECQS